MTVVTNTELTDLDKIFELFEHSINYQESRGYPVWRNYDKSAIINDIRDKNQYKVVIDSQIAIIFSVRYSDKIIWRDLDNGNAVYLHRIVVNPVFKGRKLFGEVVKWVVDDAKQKRLDYVRMDTWANNPNIIEYYKGFGFKVVENYTTPDTQELPVHNRNLALTLLELELDKIRL